LLNVIVNIFPSFLQQVHSKFLRRNRVPWRTLVCTSRPISAVADGPRDATSSIINRRTVCKTGGRVWSTGDNRQSWKHLGHVHCHRQVSVVCAHVRCEFMT